MDDTKQGYAEEAFDPDFEMNEDEDNMYDVNIQGHFEDIVQDEDVDLMMDAIDNVYDDHEAELMFNDKFPYFQQDIHDKDYEPDLKPPIGESEDEMPINFDDMETDLDDHINELNDLQEEEIQFKAEEEAQMTSPRHNRLVATYAQVAKGCKQSSTSKGALEERQSNRSDNKKKKMVNSHQKEETHQGIISMNQTEYPTEKDIENQSGETKRSNTQLAIPTNWKQKAL